MKKGYIITPVVLALLLLVSVAWGYNERLDKIDYEIALDNHYQRLFYDVKNHVENVQVGISKSLVASTKERNILLFSQIMTDANFAQDKLAQMPISHNDISNTQKFLTQAADYSYFLIQKHLDGQDITDEQRQTLGNLQNNSAAFNEELAILQDGMQDSSAIYGVAAMGKDSSTEDESAFQTSLINLDSQVGDTPELIYDGPFADQILNRKPVGLGEENTSLKKAKELAINFFGKDRVEGAEAFEQGEDINELRIPAHTFNIYEKNAQKDMAAYMGVSQKGGRVLWMRNPRAISNIELSIEEAQEYALKYLKEKGFETMEPNYYLEYDGGVLFNFVYKQGDITIYPDLVKVKVALDTGEVIGFDASAYYLNHQNRKLGKTSISKDEARKKLRVKFNIDSERLAVIPKGKEEILCYEFKGKYDDNDFIIYINAINGKEEDILQIIKNENGTLTF